MLFLVYQLVVTVEPSVIVSVERAHRQTFLIMRQITIIQHSNMLTSCKIRPIWRKIHMKILEHLLAARKLIQIVIR